MQLLLINDQTQNLKEHCPTEKAQFRLASFHVISPNATKYPTKLDKKIL